MPLIKGKSDKAFKHNLKTEYKEGKPLKQSLAIAYSLKRKAQHKARGGEMHENDCSCPACCMAKGGEVKEDKYKPKRTVGREESIHKKEPIPQQPPAAQREGAGYMERKYRNYDDGGSVIGEDLKSSMRQAFKTPPSQMAKETKDSNQEPSQTASNQNKGMVLKNMHYSKGGEVHNQGALKDQKYIMDEMDRDDFLTGEGYLLKDSPFHKERIASNSMAHSEDSKRLNQHKVDMHASNDMMTDDLVDRIMDKRSQDFSQEDRYAMGGHVPYPDAGTSYMDDEDDMVGRIMHKRQNPMHDYADEDRHYSKGGRVANQEHGENNNEMAGFSPNEFDDLVLRDDLESSYGDDDNAGDALGNKQEDEDRDDIISRIMRSRAKKDRMPNPA